MPAGVPLLLALLLASAGAPHARAAPPGRGRHAVGVSGDARVSTLSRNSASHSQTTRVKRIPIGRVEDTHKVPTRREEYHPEPADDEVEHISRGSRKGFGGRPPQAAKKSDDYSQAGQQVHYQPEKESEDRGPVRPHVSRATSQTHSKPETTIRRVQVVDVTGDGAASTTSNNAASHTSSSKITKIRGRSASNSREPSDGTVIHLPPGARETIRQDDTSLRQTNAHIHHKSNAKETYQPPQEPSTTEPHYPPQEPPTKEPYYPTHAPTTKEPNYPTYAPTTKGPYYPPQEPPKKDVYHYPPSGEHGKVPISSKSEKLTPTTSATVTNEPYKPATQEPIQAPPTTPGVSQHHTATPKTVHYPTTSPTPYPPAKPANPGHVPRGTGSSKSGPPPCYSQNTGEVAGASVSQSTRTKTRIVSAKTADGTQVRCQETSAAKELATRSVAKLKTKVDSTGSGTIGLIQPTENAGFKSHSIKTRDGLVPNLPAYPAVPTSESQELGDQKLRPILLPDTSGKRIREPPSFSDVVRDADENAALVNEKLAAIESTRIVDVVPPSLSKVDDDEKAYRGQMTAPKTTGTQKLVPLPIRPESSAAGATRFETPGKSSKPCYPKPIPSPVSSEQHPKQGPKHKGSRNTAQSNEETFNDSIKVDNSLDRRYINAKRELDRSQKTFACSGALCTN